VRKTTLKLPVRATATPVRMLAAMPARMPKVLVKPTTVPLRSPQTSIR
jgi:hypothetical protein